MARNRRARFGVQESVQGVCRDQSGCMLKVRVQTLRGCLFRASGVQGQCRDRGDRPKLEGDVPEKE